ncbi:hypothetical protein BC629DRAFT_1535590 [Irpex lacteus]|nr:hypothetical protein BC629DRAFT_1535590 [Irpex lacteus]
MPATSRSVVLVGVAAATATLLFYILQAAEHPDRVRTQSINSGLNLHSPSVTALALLSFVAWTPSSKVKATLALILSLAVSVGLDVVFMLYAAHHLIHSTTLFSLGASEIHCRFPSLFKGHSELSII